MAVITNSIGTASRDYSTIALWEAALPASAVTAGNSYVGQCYADSEFNLGTTPVTFGGTTTDATHTITLTTGPGQGFRDNASAATNALRYNASNGVAIKCSAGYDRTIDIGDQYVTLSNLQILNTASNGQGCVQFNLGGSSTNGTVDSCIIQAGGRSGSNITLQITDSGVVKNTVVITDTSGSSQGIWCDFNNTVLNCTVVKPSDKTSTGSGIHCAYGTTTITNCVVAGYATNIDTNATKTGTNNATDGASFPSGLSGQTSLTIATEFVQPSNASSAMDWRLNSTSVACKDNGTNSGAPTTDIIGQAISNTTRDVGAWELQQGGGGGGGAVSHRLSLMGAGA